MAGAAADLAQRYDELRRTHEEFVYAGYDVDVAAHGLTIRHDFTVSPDLAFAPQVTFLGVASATVAALQPGTLDRIAFSLGMAELLSYWKAACPPRVRVDAGPLSTWEADWWDDLLRNGMAEFFHRNGILDRLTSPIAWLPADTSSRRPLPVLGEPGRTLHMVSGGKDSAAGLRVLTEAGRDVVLMLLNPSTAGREVAEEMGHPTLVIERRIDPRLLALNDAGYLNGHTPFSSYLAFLGWAGALLTGCTEVVTSNSRSDEHANAALDGRVVNHQYSKTVHFEGRFNDYVARHLGGIERFYSAVRPLDELDTVTLLAESPSLLQRISSCDAKGRRGRWCGRCYKCLSTFVLVGAVTSLETVVGMFEANLLADASLEPVLLALLGLEEERPWQCTATPEEIALALTDLARAHADDGLPLLVRARELLAKMDDATRTGVAGRARPSVAGLAGAMPDDVEAALGRLLP